MSAHNEDDIPFEQWSESENVSIAGFNEQQLEGCHWYGQKRFYSALARIVFRTSQDLETIAGLDTLLHDVSSAFPYKSQLDSMRRSLSFSVSGTIEVRSRSPRQAYLTVFGVVAIKGKSEDKKAFVDSLSREARSILTSMSQNNGDGEGIREGSDIDMDTQSSVRHDMPSLALADDLEDPRIQRALSALYECGIRQGFRPQYQEEESTEPLGFLARVTIRGQTFAAVAQSKKLAKQVAALKACDALRVVVVT